MPSRNGNANQRPQFQAIAAIIAFAFGVWLACQHPVAPWWAAAAFLTTTAIAFRLPGVAFFLVPALLPFAGLATWTGWIIVEEFDLLVLGVVAGRFAAMALGAARQSTEARIPAVSLALVVLFFASVGASAVKGYLAAGSASVGLFAGYYDALNSLRIAKPCLSAILMLLALGDAVQQHGKGILDRLMTGCATGLALASLAVVWERVAFVGLLDFSSNYRATALFWETHVGGAALDGFLALTVPFAVLAWIRARTLVGIAVTTILMVTVGYVCLVTYSRGIYVAMPIALTALLLTLPRSRRPDVSNAVGYLIRLIVMVSAMIFAAWLAIHHGGYRALAVVLGVVAVALALAPVIRGSSALTAKTVALATLGALAAAAVAVAAYGGGAAAGFENALALIVILCLVFAHSRSSKPLWRDDRRSLSLVVVAAIGLSGAVAVFSGGAYMEGRFASSQADLELRLSHWRQVIRMLDTPEGWLFGKGLGRYPASYLNGAESGELPGSYRLEIEGGEQYVALSGPSYGDGAGDWLRFAQRVPNLDSGIYRVRLDARARRSAVLQIELCEKHLLYSAGCAAGAVQLDESYPSWQSVTLHLDGREIAGGPWYAPRLALLSIAVASAGLPVDIDNISVLGDDPRNLIVNGNFSDGLSRWFFTSDNEHLPWHVQNLALNVVFEQGVVGLVLFGMLVAGAVVRLVFVVRNRQEAPFIASSLIGFLAVGAFDSLLDMPRVAFLFYFFVFLGLILPSASSASDRPRE